MDTTYSLRQWQADLQAAARPEKIKILSSFFKTGKGQYGEGDRFIGLTVPDNRKIAKMAVGLSDDDVSLMLSHPIHEFRLSALIVLCEKTKKTKTEAGRKAIADFYLAHARYINNWDLVDLSCPTIIGPLIDDADDRLTLPMLDAESLWLRRIAVVATLHTIRQGKFTTALRNVSRLLHDSHDLMHKANGWMLREIGKKDTSVLLGFLDKNAATMPRTTLRYAIERLEPEQKRYYMRLRQ